MSTAVRTRQVSFLRRLCVGVVTATKISATDDKALSNAVTPSGGCGKDYCGMQELRWSVQETPMEDAPAGWSKRPSSEAAANEGPKRTLWGTLRV
jgi:hypothetical protein